MQSSKRKATLITLVKMTVTIALVYWLIAEKKLDLSTLKYFYSNPNLFAVNLFVWILSPLALGAVRWFYIMKELKLPLGYKKVLSFQSMGLFFNIAMPGAVGGDVVKTLLVYRELQKREMSKIAISIVLDRIIGLIALITLGLVFIGLNLKRMLSMEQMGPVLLTSFFMFLALSFILIVVFWPSKLLQKIIDSILSLPILCRFSSLYNSLKELHGKPKILYLGFFFSILAQCLTLIFLWFICSSLGISDINFQDLMIIYPIGALITIIPLAPGGMGVGHVAFEKLFHLVNAHGGANAFNLFFIGQTALNCFGILPFLRNRPQMTELTQIEKNVIENIP